MSNNYQARLNAALSAARPSSFEKVVTFDTDRMNTYLAHSCNWAETAAGVVVQFLREQENLDYGTVKSFTEELGILVTEIEERGGCYELILTDGSVIQVIVWGCLDTTVAAFDCVLDIHSARRIEAKLRRVAERELRAAKRELENAAQAAELPQDDFSETLEFECGPLWNHARVESVSYSAKTAPEGTETLAERIVDELIPAISRCRSFIHNEDASCVEWMAWGWLRNSGVAATEFAERWGCAGAKHMAVLKDGSVLRFANWDGMRPDIDVVRINNRPVLVNPFAEAVAMAA